jgi:hypothetical protein
LLHKRESKKEEEGMEEKKEKLYQKSWWLNLNMRSAV